MSALDDVQLARAALNRDPEALEKLRALVEREVKQAVRNQRGAEVLADEVSQQLFSRLLVGEGVRGPKLLEYSGRGPIGAWLRASALGIALNARRGEKPSEPLDDLAIVSNDPEVEYMRNLCKAEFNRAFTDAMATLATRERNLVRLRFLDGLTLEELASYFRVHRATVVRWLAEVTDRLYAATRIGLSERLSIDTSEVDSVVRAARSRIDLSLTGLLKREHGEAPGEERGAIPSRHTPG
jgi:RNA polymerase sigma-70 factor (ECF subfamily)